MASRGLRISVIGSKRNLASMALSITRVRRSEGISKRLVISMCISTMLEVSASALARYNQSTKPVLQAKF